MRSIVSGESLDDLLYDHVLGSGSPCDSLLSGGLLPVGWVDRYLELLAGVNTSHAGCSTLPRRTVWAVHFASWYLPLRYDVWCNTARDSNTETVSQFARLRTPSEMFISNGLDHCDS